MEAPMTPSSMRVKAEQHESPEGMDFRGGLIATLRTSPGNHCLAQFMGIDGATRDMSPEVAERFAAAWNLCQGMPLEALKELSKQHSPLVAALNEVVGLAASYNDEHTGGACYLQRQASIDMLNILIEGTSPKAEAPPIEEPASEAPRQRE